MRRGMEGDQPVVLLRRDGSPGCSYGDLKVICIVGSLLLKTLHRFYVVFRSGQFAGQSSTVLPLVANRHCGSVPNPTGK